MKLRSDPLETPRSLGSPQARILRHWTAICAWRGAAVVWSALLLVGLSSALAWMREQPWGRQVESFDRPWAFAVVGLGAVFVLGAFAARITRALRRPGQLGITFLLASVALLTYALIFNTQPEPLYAARLLGNPATLAKLIGIGIGLWLLALPSWPRRRSWRRSPEPPFLAVPPEEEAAALRLTRWLPLGVVPACLLLYGGPWPLWVWPAGLICGYWCERWSRSPEAPRTAAHVLPWLEWLLWLASSLLVLGLAVNPAWRALSPRWLQIVCAALPCTCVLVAGLRHRLRRRSRISIIWLWAVVAALLAMRWWQAPGAPELGRVTAGASPLLIYLNPRSVGWLGLAVILLLGRVLFRAFSAYWWLAGTLAITVIAWLLGPEGLALLGPLVGVLWLLQRQIISGRLKWLTLAGLVAGLSWAWHLAEALWLCGGLLIYVVVLGTRATALMDSQLDPRRTRWFGLLALGMGLAPSLLISLVALGLSGRLAAWAAQIVASVSLAGGAAPWPRDYAHGSYYALCLLIVLGWWAVSPHLRPRLLHPLAGLLLIVLALASLGLALWIAGDPLGLSQLPLSLLVLLIACLLAWRAGPAWHLPVPLHAPLVRGVFAVFLGVVVCYGLNTLSERVKPMPAAPVRVETPVALPALPPLAPPVAPPQPTPPPLEPDEIPIATPPASP